MATRIKDATEADGNGAMAVGAFVLRHLVWLILAASTAVLALTLEPFWTASNLLNILNQSSIIGLLAIGMTLVLIAGHFDLSVGAILTLAAVLAIKMQPVDALGTLAALTMPLVVGMMVGVINGAFVGGLGANSIIVTVGMQFVLAGATLLIVAGQNVRVDQAAEAFIAIGAGRLLGVPLPVVLLVSAAIILHLVMTRTLFGRHVTAVGGNPVAGHLVGIPVTRRILATYVISGLLAATAGIVVAARVRNLDPTAGIGYELAALTAAVLGGTRLTGGHGDVLNTLAGVLLLGVAANAMRLLDLSYNLQLLLQGLVLVSAVALDARLRMADR